MTTGSIAAGHYAQPRMTRDIDLVIDVAPDDADMWIVSPEDLVLSKLAWSRDTGSELQLRDVRQLVASQPNLDRTYLARWAGELGVGELLKDVLP
jgi:hypothetical protein